MSESRKIVTIVFTDVTGSTALGEQLDPEAMRRVMDRYFAEMRTVLERHGGTVEKFIGDAVMAVFGIPVVHEDDALRALRAASEMRERLAALNSELSAERGVTIAVRTGVNTGEVVAGDPGQGQAFATGDAVNVAARLEQAAAPGQILIGPQTHRLVREAVRAEAVAPLELKGKAEPVEAWRLVEVLPYAPAFSRRIDAPFVGRERELSALRGAYDRARDGGSCELATVTGAPGIGKSRLVRELLAGVGSGPRVVVGRCLSYGEGITYWPLAEIVRQIAGSEPRAGLVELFGPEPDAPVVTERILAAIGATDETARTEEIFWATRLLFERLARTRPLVVVVDDIHWAEPTLLDLIEYLVGFTRAPVLVTCTARPELFESRPDWPRDGTVLLDALSDDESAALIEALLSESDLSAEIRGRITERAEGNPLFVEQMLALARDNGADELAVPPTIQALLATRLDHLSAEERAVLVRGAVEGRLFHRGAVSALLPQEERDEVPGRLLTLARKAFVRPDEAVFPGDDAFRFVHVLVRDAAYEAAPKDLRAELHESFAAWLEDRAPDQEAVIGYHLEQSHRYRSALGESADDVRVRAGERLAAAGERAFKQGDFRGAANLLGRASGLLSSARRLELVSRLAEALIEGGRLQEARSLLEDTVAETRKTGAEALALRHEIELDLLSVQLESEWSADAALARVERAMPILEAAHDSLGLYRAWDAVRTVGWMRGRLQEAIAAADKALTFAEEVGDTNLIANALTGKLAPTWYGDTPLSEILPEHARQLEWARAVGQRALEGSMLWVLGRIHLEQGRPDEGEPLMQEGLAIVDSLGLVIHASGLRSQFSPADLASDPERVEESVRASYELLKSLNETGFLSTQAAALAMLLAKRDELDEAERLTRESELLGSADDVTTQAGWRSARARVFARRGSLAEAEVLANEALSIATKSEYAAVRAEAHLALADVLSRAGKITQAIAATEEALRIFEHKEMAAASDAIGKELTELQAKLSAGVPPAP